MFALCKGEAVNVVSVHPKHESVLFCLLLKHFELYELVLMDPNERQDPSEGTEFHLFLRAFSSPLSCLRP